MQLHSAFLGGWVQPADVFVQFYAGEPNAFWLDGEFAPVDRFSILGAGVEAQSSTQDELARYHFDNQEYLPFKWRPGLVGIVTYEGEPGFISADRAIVFDHERQGLYFVGLFESPAEFEFWHHGALLRLGLSGGQVATYLHSADDSALKANSVLRHSPESYIALIEKAQQHIAAGDIYQLCLTNQISIETEVDPLSVFLKLRQTNPAPYSALVRIGALTLVSSSPEQFLQVSQDGQISTKPIKGTRPRGLDPKQDEAIANGLQMDAKERAENLMIVDLMRNDIGKVSQVGSVAVPKLLPELVTDFVWSRIELGRDGRTVQTYRHVLGSLARAWPLRYAHDLTREEVRVWLRGTGWTASTQNKAVGHVRGMFQWAISQKHAGSDPCEGMERLTVTTEEVEGLTLDECERLLRTALEVPRFMPYLVLGLFRGMRRSELERLRWEELNLDEGTVIAAAAKVKTRQRRVIEITPQIRAWIAAAGWTKERMQTGPVAPSNLKEKWPEFWKKAGLTRWPHNALRHTFASMHYAMFGDQAALQMILGQRSAEVLHTNYRALKTRAEAERFWGLMPLE